MIIARLNIRQARINAALSQRDLARRLGVSSVAVVKWESGKTFPSADKLPALAKSPAGDRAPLGATGLLLGVAAFLRITQDPAARPHLLDYLQQQGLLESFLEAECGGPAAEKGGPNER